MERWKGREREEVAFYSGGDDESTSAFFSSPSLLFSSLVTGETSGRVFFENLKINSGGEGESRKLRKRELRGEREREKSEKRKSEGAQRKKFLSI